MSRRLALALLPLLLGACATTPHPMLICFPVEIMGTPAMVCTTEDELRKEQGERRPHPAPAPGPGRETTRLDIKP